MQGLRVRDIVPLIRTAGEINLSWNGSLYPIVPTDAVEMEAFGDFAVEYITASGTDANGMATAYELGIRVKPIKAGE